VSLRRRYGFTLIELLVVVAIIGIASGVGVGLYNGTYKRLLVEKAARDFLFAAKYGRIMAIEKQRRYKIQLDNEEEPGFSLVTTEWSGVNEQFESMVVQDHYSRPVKFEGSIRFEDIMILPGGEEETEDEDAQSITFSPDGTAQPVVVQIGDGRTHYTISIAAATGKAKIHFGTLENAEMGTIDLDAQ